MKLVGLVVTLVLVTLAGIFYWQNTETKNDLLPDSYKLMDALEQEGIFPRNIEFSDIDGKKIVINSFANKVLIFSFWATWCEPCVEEFPSFVKLLDKFPGKIVLVALSHDEDPKDIRQFIKAFSGYRQNLILAQDKDKKISEMFGVGLLPEGYIFNTEGKLVKKIMGIQDWASKNAFQFFEEL